MNTYLCESLNFTVETAAIRLTQLVAMQTAAICAELKHMCLGDLGSKHLQISLHFIHCIYCVFILFILIGCHLFLLRASCILETEVIYT